MGNDDNGALPMKLAAKAHSTAIHVRDEMREHRREQAQVNISAREELGALAGQLNDVREDLAGLRGEIKGQARAAKNGLVIVGVVVSLVSVLAPLLLRALGAH
jgi:hypothetical protein